MTVPMHGRKAVANRACIGLVTAKRSRIIWSSESKVEPLASGVVDDRIRAEPLARVIAGQLQRRVCPGLLRRCLFSAAARLVAADVSVSSDGRAHERAVLSRRAGQPISARQLRDLCRHYRNR